MKVLHRKYWSLFFLPAALLITLAACGTNAQPEVTENEARADRYQIGEPLTDSRIAATVTSEYGADTLRMSEFRTQMDNVSRFFGGQIPEGEQMEMIRANIISQFVDRHLLVGEAGARGIEADPVELETQLTAFQDQFPDQETYRNWLREQNMTEDFVRQEMREQVRLQTLIERMAGEGDAPDAAEIERFREEQAVEVNARHILFRLERGADSARAAEVEARANAILDSIRAGADFEEMAGEHSEDPGSAQQGGELGFFSRGQMVPEFEEAAFELQQPGDIAPQPVRSQFGYHIIQLIEKRDGDPIDAQAATEMLTQRHQDEHFQQALKSLRAKATVRVNPAAVDPEVLERSLEDA